MKLEHKRQKVLSLPRFLLRVGRYLMFCLLLIAISVLLGTWGYCHYAKMSFLDGFYMSCMILTGMGPTEPLHDPNAKVFASFYALYSGVAFLSITA